MVPPFQALGICLKSPGSTTWKLQDGLSAIVHIEPNIFVGFPGFSLVPLGVLDLAKLDLDSQVDTFSGFPTKTTPSMVKEVSAMLVATWYRAPKLRTCKIHPQDCPQPLPLPANLQQSVTEFLSMTESEIRFECSGLILISTKQTCTKWEEGAPRSDLLQSPSGHKIGSLGISTMIFRVPSGAAGNTRLTASTSLPREKRAFPNLRRGLQMIEANCWSSSRVVISGRSCGQGG